MAFGSSTEPKGGRVRINMNVDRLRQQFPAMAQRLIQKAVVDLQAKLVRTIYKEVVELTPVLTGQARNNWDLNLNDKPYGIVPGPTDVDATGTSITPAEREKVKQLVSELRAMPAGQKVWITNNVPYVHGLDVGDSTKAPNGIRAIAVDRALNQKLKLKGVRSEQDGEVE